VREKKLRYSDITFNGPSSIKRYVQRRRLVDALCVLDDLDYRCAGTFLDFGGGNGELTKMIAERFPKAQVVCYEPSPEMFAEASLVCTCHCCVYTEAPKPWAPTPAGRGNQVQPSGNPRGARKSLRSLAPASVLC